MQSMIEGGEIPELTPAMGFEWCGDEVYIDEEEGEDEEEDD